MLSQNNYKATALSIDDIDISFEELNELIEKKKIPPCDKVHWLKASSQLGFIIELLACFRQEVPCLVYSDVLSNDDREYLENILEKETVNPNCKLILLTSGSSGKPKVVQISHKNIMTNINAINKSLDFEEIESQVLFLPLSYSFGLIGQLLTALHLGKKTFVVDEFVKVKKIVEVNSVQMISGVPSQLQSLTRLLSSESCITHVVSAGAPLYLEIRKKLSNHFKKATIYNNYGQTELTPRALSFNSKDPLFFTDITGRPVPGIDYKIQNETLYFKGDAVMLGYLGSKNSIDSKGWLNTGDRAIEKNGYITILGRHDSLIKISGKRLSSIAIESFIIKTLEVEKVVCLYKQDIGLISIFLEKKDIDNQSLKEINNNFGINLTKKNYKTVSKMPLLANGKVDKSKL